MAEFTSVTLAAEKTVLMVVDMEHEFCTPGGLRYSPKAEVIIPILRRLIGRARKNKVPIIFCHSVRNQREPAVTVFGYDKVLQEGAWGSEIVPGLLSREDDLHIYKYSHSPWWQTNLEEVLATLTDDPTDFNAIVTGVAAAGCAYRAVMGFHLRDYWTLVPQDCVDDNDWAKKQFALPDYYNVFPTRSDLISFGALDEVVASRKEEGNDWS